MNSKGFTLVEIIGIILFLGIIFFIAFPVLSNMTEQNTKNKYDNFVENLCIAGKTYMYSNIDKFPMISIKNEIIEIKISELIEYGNVEKKLINPTTKLSVENDLLRYIVLEDYTLDCIYIEE